MKELHLILRHQRDCNLPIFMVPRLVLEKHLAEQQLAD
jgi:hypothetical protein